jgi:hypothetical protein
MASQNTIFYDMFSVGSLNSILSKINRQTVILLLAVATVIFVFSFSYNSFIDTPNIHNYGFWKRLEEFIQSDNFNKLLPTIIIPLIVFIWKIYDDHKKQKEEELKEERKRREEQLKEKRLETIEQTFEQWNQINKILSEVRFYGDEDEEKENKRIKDIQSRIAEHSISFGKLIYSWSSRFPIVPDTLISLFGNYTIVLYWSAWAAAYSIRHTKEHIQNVKTEQYKELQESIGMFQRGIVSISFINLIYILKESSQLLEDIEEYFGSDEHIQYSTIAIIRTSIEKNFKNVFDSRENGCIYAAINEESKSTGVRIKQYLKMIEESSKANKKVETYEQDNNSLNHESYLYEPITVFWNKYEEQIELLRKKIREELDTELGAKVIHAMKANKRIFKDIDNIIKYLCRLKLYELILGMDRFAKGEILPSGSEKFWPEIIDFHYHDSAKTEHLRELYQNIRYMIMEQMPNFPKDWNNDKYTKILTSKEYSEFERSFYGITNTDLMTMVAADTLQYVRLTGKAIRFCRLLFCSEDMTPVS